MVRVTTAARVHFGFCNLSLSHERLYGGLGVALDAPTVEVRARPAATPEVRGTSAHVRVAAVGPRDRGVG